MRGSRAGFTLIELMIVVVILGILSAIAIPKYRDITESARYAACRSNLRNIAGGLNMYLAENNQYPPGEWLEETLHHPRLCPRGPSLPHNGNQLPIQNNGKGKGQFQSSGLERQLQKKPRHDQIKPSVNLTNRLRIRL